MKYWDSFVMPEEPVRESYYHKPDEIRFYFENMDD